VSRAIAACHGVNSVKVDLAAGRATLAGEHLDLPALIAAVESCGYRATAIEDQPSKR
jgi:hypothetical protein